MNLDYLRPVADHLWQSTAFVVIAGLLTLALRKNRARVRHAIWLAASCKFLIPISLLITLGSHIEWRTAAVVPPAVSVVMDEVSQPFSSPTLVSPMALPREANPLPAILVGIWFCGFIGISASWLLRWLRIRAIVLSASLANLKLPVESKYSLTLIEPGVFGIFRPVLLLPESIADRLTPAQLNAVIAHELCHIRHRDNLTATIQMFVETVFWFHPLVWWIGKRMLEERERACDEEVLRTRCQPRAYADAILHVCRLYAESPLPCVAGVTGADLKKRIEEILANRKICGLTGGRKVLLVAAAVLALTVPVVIGLIDVSQLSAQPKDQPEFEVVAVRQHAGPLSPNTLVNPTVLPGGRFVSRTFLRNLIAYAYKVPFNRSARITGFPDWVSVDLHGDSIYDIEATSVMPPGLSIEARNDHVRAMVQALLVDRFKLVIRRESKEMPVYALVVARGGPKLHPADIDQRDCPEASVEPVGLQPPVPGACHAISAARIGLRARAASISDLAAFVENWTDRPLLDKTGIQGLYRFETKRWPPRTSSMEARSTNVADDGPTVVQVFEDLGLRMEAQRGIVDVYVIDHLEKPSEK